jgi:hypothetical protein
MYKDRVRPYGWLHEKRCLAAAVIAAVENMRDSEYHTDLSFRIALQNNEALQEADGYLSDGPLMNCTCEAPWPLEAGDRVVRRLDGSPGTVVFNDLDQGGVGVLLDAVDEKGDQIDVLGAEKAWRRE